MEIDQIETFIAVGTFGGFHRAAEALRVSQPAVSARIKALEESLGATLFTRSHTGLTLSEAGRILKPYAEQLLRTASLAREGTSLRRVCFAAGLWCLRRRWSSREGLYRGDRDPSFYGPAGIRAAAR